MPYNPTIDYIYIYNVYLHTQIYIIYVHTHIIHTHTHHHLTKNMNKYLHSGIIFNSPKTKLGIAQISLSSKMGKLWYSHTLEHSTAIKIK